MRRDSDDARVRPHMLGEGTKTLNAAHNTVWKIVHTAPWHAGGEVMMGTGDVDLLRSCSRTDSVAGLFAKRIDEATWRSI